MRRLPPHPQSPGRTLLATLLLLLFLFPPSTPLGINCRGSFYCLGQSSNNVTGKILDLTSTLPPHAIYGFDAHVACLGATDRLRGNIGAFCLFMQGNNAHGIYNPATGDRVIGIEGELIGTKMLELYGHGCRACGSVPIADDNDPDKQGILTLNYVSDNAGCGGNQVCAPTIAAGDMINNPFNAENILDTPSVMIPTANGSQACVEPGAPIVADAQGVPLDDCGDMGVPSPNATLFGIESAKANNKTKANANANDNDIVNENANVNGTSSPVVVVANTSTLTIQRPMPTEAPTTVLTVFSTASYMPVSSGPVIDEAIGCPNC